MNQMLSLLYPLILLLFTSCNHPSSLNNKTTTDPNPYLQQLKEYWYSGLGELSSYRLEQARYGEIRKGHSVLIFVTEDFSTKTYTKADQADPENISVLKLNATRKFQTGIYPYSMMSSSFFPFPDGKNAIKISTSSQEWCGHTYLEMIEQDDFEIANHSYFQSEAEKKIKLKKALLEDDLWTMIRLNPDNLPSGKMQVIPSFIYLRLSHHDIKSYEAELNLIKTNEQSELIINYPELERTLAIQFENTFPFQITGWTDTYNSGWGDNRKTLTTKASLIKTIRTDYWTKNHVADSVWSERLGLD